MKIRAVILDFGDTLASGSMDWDEYHIAIKGILKGFGHHVELTRLKKSIRAALDELAKVRARGKELTLEEIYGSALSRVRVAADDEILEAIHDAFRRHYKSEFYPCTKNVLNELSQRYKLAMLSNTMSDKPRLQLEEAELDGLFEVMICSRDLGIRKPNPKIFEYVLKELGVAPGEAIHVGDSVEADMEGAVGAGITPVWINTPSQRSWSGYTISSICELPDFLKILERDELLGEIDG